ncbi:hypothetical protein JAAARDRAFT_201199 [Jaapia argillacea MUCL 33604]|uniref:Uncharacterized protein n=1 Tax=Jaapia argillacea MUCL 33604 TaxID=933084 RepID=A0A067PEY2_9AGAM|nr:hypothetical protein JAAARDRAFT_201199 [Jaapia argillacea MUCL 33604]
MARGHRDPNPYLLLEEDIDVLDGFLDRYKMARRHERVSVVDEASEAVLRRLQSGGPATVSDELKRSIHAASTAWLLKQCPRSVTDLLKFFMRNWNTKVVFEFVEREVIMAAVRKWCQDEGDPVAVFKYYQKVVSRLMKALDPNTKEEYEKMAAQWNEEGPPEAVRQRAAELRAVASVIKFQTLIYEKMGVYMVSIFGYQGSNGKTGFYCLDMPGTNFLKGNKEWSLADESVGIFAAWLKIQLAKDAGHVQEDNIKIGRNLKPSFYEGIGGGNAQRLPQPNMESTNWREGGSALEPSLKAAQFVDRCKVVAKWILQRSIPYVSSLLLRDAEPVSSAAPQ